MQVGGVDETEIDHLSSWLGSNQWRRLIPSPRGRVFSETNRDVEFLRQFCNNKFLAGYSAPARTAAQTSRRLDQPVIPKANYPSLNSNTGYLNDVDTFRKIIHDDADEGRTRLNRRDLWSDPANVEWLDWKGTPNTGHYVNWGQPWKLAPQACFNSPANLPERLSLL